MSTSAFILSRQQRIPLANARENSEPTVVAAETLTIEIEGSELPSRVRLNGDDIPLLRNEAATRGHMWVNAYVSVGFHCLRVGEDEYFFATDDAKLKLDGIRRILDFLKEEGLSWRGPLFFSNGTAIRSPKVDHAWLVRMADRVIATADAIADRPMRRYRESTVVQTPGSGRLCLTETFALLRGNPRVLLEARDDGALAIADKRYFPRAVVAARQDRSFDTIGNRRMTHVLLLVQDLCRNLSQELEVPRHVQDALRRIARDIGIRLDMFPFSTLELLPGQLPHRPGPEEIADDRYSDSYDLYEELQDELSWEAGLRVADRFAYVGSADLIYQAFVAVVLADAFEAKQVSTSMQSNLAGPLFKSQDYDIYYDTPPPRPDFASWRDNSTRPAAQRPDLTIINRRSRVGILLDAKYRAEQTGILPPSALGEAQVYMQSFERKALAIIYPGKTLGLSRVEARGYTILEVSLGPYDGIQEFARSTVRPALEALMEALGGFD